MKRKSSTHSETAVSNAVRLALLATSVPILALPNLVVAQDQEAELDEIIITGSRVTNPNLEQASQILVLNEEEILNRQALDAESLIGELPGIAPGLNKSLNNGSEGTATLNLRALGGNRNLVLIDGQRLVPSDLQGRTDLNNIPIALIERVDIVSGGASSVYGADAVAGVANFVTKRNFNGVEVSMTASATGEQDGETQRIDLTFGGDFNGGKGNVALNLGYQDINGITQGQRSISQVTQFGTLPLGSGTSVPTRINEVQFDPATGMSQPTETFNYAPFNYFQTPLEKTSLYGKARYEVAPDIDVYTTVMYSNNRVDLQLAPSGMFGDTWIMPLNNPFLPDFFRNEICANPLNGIDQASCDAAGAAVNSADPNYIEVPVVVNRRFVEQGNRQTEYLTNVYQFTLGSSGQISEKWSFDVSASYGESVRTQTNRNWGLKSLVQQALFATDTDTCDPTKNPTIGCVPVNLFGDGQSISAEAIDFFNKPNGSTFSTSLGSAVASISGDFDAPEFLPTDLPIGIAAGLEYRRYEASQQADIASATQDEVLGTGQPDKIFSGSFDTQEVFLEAIVPIVSGKTGIESLSLETGVRSSDYSTSGQATTWKAGLVYAVNDSVKIRSLVQESSRSPNILELFDPPKTGLNNLVFDPCQGTLADGVTPNPALSNTNIRSICIAQGAPPASFDNGLIPQPSANQINETTEGNAFLDVETARSFTVGAVITPEAIPGLAITVDYYNIEVEDAITEPTPGDIFDPCFGAGTAGDTFDGADPSAPQCALIARNPLNGGLNGGGDTPGLLLSLSNLGTIETSGIDVGVTFDKDVDWWAINNLFFDISANHTSELLFQATPTSINRECIGQFSPNCDPPLAEYSVNLRTVASMGDWGDVTLLWRWADELEFERILDNPYEGSGLGGVNDTEFLKLDAANYFDLGYRKEFGDSFSLNILVMNVLDEDPPFSGSFVGGTGWNAGNTYPSNYDAIGRRWSVTGVLRFE